MNLLSFSFVLPWSFPYQSLDPSPSSSYSYIFRWKILGLWRLYVFGFLFMGYGTSFQWRFQYRMGVVVVLGFFSVYSRSRCLLSHCFKFVHTPSNNTIFFKRLYNNHYRGVFPSSRDNLFEGNLNSRPFSFFLKYSQSIFVIFFDFSRYFVLRLDLF